MPSLKRCIHIATRQAETCVRKAEFYKGKSTASYKHLAATNWQAWAETWSSILTFLEERDAEYQDSFDLLHAENIRLSEELWQLKLNQPAA